jgi:hypothetical protein
MGEQLRAAPPAVPSRIPRYIGNLNALAENARMAVEMAVEPYGNDPALRLWSSWRGARDAFLSLVQPVASYHLPLTQGRLNIPGGSAYYAHNALVSGDVIVTGDDVLYQIDFGPPVFTISDAAGVEIVSYADETLYHGAPAALIALGIERTRLPLGRRPARSDRGWFAETERWSSRRQPDGLIVHRVESPAAFRRRREEYGEFLSEREQRVVGAESKPPTTAIQPRPSHLRLVVDNGGRT